MVLANVIAQKVVMLLLVWTSNTDGNGMEAKPGSCVSHLVGNHRNHTLYMTKAVNMFPTLSSYFSGCLEGATY